MSFRRRILRNLSGLAILSCLIMTIQVQSAAQGTAKTVYLPLIQKAPRTTAFGIETNTGTITNQTIANYAKELNGTWLRLNTVSWREVQPTEDRVYQWDVLQTFEKELAAAAQLNLTPIVIVDDNPAWATEHSPSCSAIKTSRFADFAAFMQALVKRYKVSPYNVHYWELGNEIDVPWQGKTDAIFGCWGEVEDTYFGGKQYGEMLKIVTPAIKQADSEAKVLNGGLLLDDPNTQDSAKGKPERFLEGILEAGAGNYFDILAFHAYPFYGYSRKIDSDLTNTKWVSWGGVTLGKISFLKNLLNRYGLGSKPLSLNEASMLYWEDASSPAPNPLPDDFLQTQADHIVRQLARALSQGIHSYFWYTLHASGWFSSGLLDNNQNPQPSFTAYQQFIKQTEGASSPTTTSAYGTAVEVYRFNKGTTVIDLLWSRNAEDTTVTLAKASFSTAYTRNGSTKVVSAGDPVEITVGVEPVYIERKP